MRGHVLARLSLGDRGLDRGGDGGWGHVGQIRQSHGEKELRGRCESRGREGTVRRVSRVARGGGTRAVATAVFKLFGCRCAGAHPRDLRIAHLIVRQDAERLALLRCCATGKEIDVRFGAIVGPRSRAIRRARARPSPLARLASNALVLSVFSCRCSGETHLGPAPRARSPSLRRASPLVSGRSRERCVSSEAARRVRRWLACVAARARQWVRERASAQTRPALKNRGRSASASSGAAAGIFECDWFANQETFPYGQPRRGPPRRAIGRRDSYFLKIR